MVPFIHVQDLPLDGGGVAGAHEAEQADQDEGGEEGDDDGDEADPPKVLGDVLESIAGAVFLDSGMDLEAVWGVFRHLFEMKIRKQLPNQLSYV